MKFWRKSALIAPAVIVAMTAAACGGGSSTGGKSGGGTAQGGTLIYGESTAFPDNLFPLISAGNSTATGNAEIRVLLAPFRLYPDFTYKPDTDLVVGEPVSQTTGGKQVVTYKINPKAVWSDGQPITDKDFEFTWRIQKSLDPKTGGCADVLASTGYDQISSVEGADNGKTVTVTYTTPYGDWRSLFTLFPQHIMDKTDPAANCAVIKKGWAVADGIPVSSGPFVLDKAGVNVGQKILTLTKNPKWWGATQPKLDRIIIQNVGSDPTVLVNAMRNKEVQTIYPQPQLDLVKQIKGLEPQITSGTNFGLSFEHLDFNTKNPALSDVAVRQAFAYALNRPEIVTKTVGQFDSRAQILDNRWLVNNQPGYKDNSGGGYDKQDIAKSDELLKGAGYAKGPDGIYAKGGQKLAFKIMTTQANPLRQSTIEIIAQQLKPAGFQITPFYNADIFNGPEKPTSMASGNFDIALFAWVATAAISTNASIYASPKGDAIGQNYSRGSDPQVDALLPQVAQATDPKAAEDLANQADALLWKDMFTLPLFQKPTFLAYDSNYTGIVENATAAGPLWNSETIAKKA